MCSIESEGGPPSGRGALATDPSDLDDDALRERLSNLARTANLAYTDMLRAVDILDRRALPETDGFRTAKTWLIGYLGLAGPTAARLVKTARLLRGLPELTTALQTGSVSPDHLRHVTHLADRVGANRLPETDTVLADAAQALDPARFQLVCQRIQAHLAPDGSDPGADFERRGLTLSPLKGLTAIHGQLDPEGAAALTTALDSLMAPPAEGDDRAAAQRRADALVELARLHLSAGDLPTVSGQRPHIGVLLFPQALSPSTLAALADRQENAAAALRLRQFLTDTDTPDSPDTRGPDTGGPDTGDLRSGDLRTGDRGTSDPGTSDLGTCDLDAASTGSTEPDSGAAPDSAAPDSAAPDSAAPDSAAPDSAALDGTDPAVAASRINALTDNRLGRSTPDTTANWTQPGWADPPFLDWIGAIPPEVAQRIACDGDIWRIILDPDNGMPLDVGRAHRLVPYWMRRALHARDRGCRWPGCQAPTAWSDAHHLDGWFTEHGETRVDRCILLCRWHHSRVHEGQWHIDIDPRTGEALVTRPNGMPYHLPRGRSPARNGPVTDAC